MTKNICLIGYIADLHGGGGGTVMKQLKYLISFSSVDRIGKISKKIPVEVVNLLIFTIKQIVAKKYVLLKNDEILKKFITNNHGGSS